MSFERSAREKKIATLSIHLDAVFLSFGGCPLTQADAVADALRNLTERGWRELAESALTTKRRHIGDETRRLLIVHYERRAESIRAAREARGAA
jgi:hypothetical protein